MSTIREECQKILTLTKGELDQCLDAAPFDKAVEAAFVCLKKYWVQLLDVLRRYDFESEEEEILFFKKIKPGIKAELEYYSLLYHSLLFCPLDENGQQRFWMREAERFENFKLQYPDFYSYFIAGATSHDRSFFMRRKTDDDNDWKINSTHDHLVAKLWALERYTHYARQKLASFEK